MHIVVTSFNPVKMRATRHGFERMFPGQDLQFEPVAVPSGVAEQPMSDDETRRGARQRVAAARIERPDADFWVGLEGGIEVSHDRLTALAWICVESPDERGESRTATFDLPQKVADLVRQGKELGTANDILFGDSNSKQKGGAVGLLTAGVIDRAQLYEPAVILALIPHLRADLYAVG